MKLINNVEQNIDGISQFEEAELYRTLRTRIIMKSPDIKILAMMSENTGDGKTEISMNLAKAFASAGKKVLLIDGDLRNSDLTEHYMINTKNTFNRLLKGEGKINESTVRIGDNLFLLPSIVELEYSTELLEREELNSILEYARSNFDIVVIDTLSLGNGMDGYLLSMKSDGVIFVAVENKTKSKKLRDYKEIFIEAKIPLIGAVINKIY